MRDQIFNYVSKKYKTKIEYLWAKFPSFAVMRNNQNKKWYALIMNIPYKKLKIEKDGNVDVLNIKIPDFLLKEMLLQKKGVYKSYHMSHTNWVSIVLDGTVPIKEILSYIDESYNIIEKCKK